MTDYELDQLICDALLDAIGIDFQEELSSDIVIPISEGYQQSVRHMFDEMQNTKKHAKRARRKKHLRRISGIAACLLLIGTVTIMIPSVKAAIQNGGFNGLSKVNFRLSLPERREQRACQNMK